MIIYSIILITSVLYIIIIIIWWELVDYKEIRFTEEEKEMLKEIKKTKKC